MNVDRDLKRIAGWLACWSFTSLVVTGQLTWVTTVLIYSTYAYVFLRRDVCERIPLPAWRIANLLVFPAAIVSAHYDLGYTLVYGTAYLQIQQMIRAKTVRDYSWLFMVSFFQLALAGAVSSELSFLIIVGVYLVLGVLAITLLTLQHGRAEVERKAARLGGLGKPLTGEGPPLGFGDRTALQSPTILRRRYAMWMLGTCAAVSLLSTFFFVITPRLAIRRSFISLRAFDPTPVTGFSDQVYADRLGGIHKDRTIVMWVYPENSQDLSAPGPAALRMRGVALDSFNAGRWAPGPWARQQAETYPMEWAQRHFRAPFAYQMAHSMRLLIVQDLHQTKWLFAPPFVSQLEVEGTGNIVFNPALHSITAAGFSGEHLRYHVLSYLEASPSYVAARVAATERLLAARDDAATSGELFMPDRMKKLYTLLPEHLPDRKRIQALADQITQGARTPYERAYQILRFFNESFTYSLTPEPPRSGNYLTHFLFTGREGHCELMASGMAVLCRLAGIPARVVNGFYSTEYNSYQHFFYVRQNHTHTWVEVWMDGYGWLTMDPTPPSALDRGRIRFPILAYLTDWWDSWTVLWRRYIVDYSLADQWRFLWRVRDWWELRSGGLDRRGPLSNWLDRRNWDFRSRNDSEGGRDFTWHGLSLAGLVATWVIYRRQAKRNGGRGTLRRGRGAWPCPVAFYAQILGALRKRGWRRQPDQTPADFARTVGRACPDLRELVPVTDTYYRVRYNGDEIGPSERAQILTLLLQIPRTLRCSGRQ